MGGATLPTKYEGTMWNKEQNPKSGLVVVGFYEDGENSFTQLCRYDEREQKWYGVGCAMPDEQTGKPDFWIERPEMQGVHLATGYRDEIIIYDYDEHKAVIEQAGLRFEDGECPVDMMFGDGLAKTADGKLEMTYPTIEEVKQSEQMQAEIIAYTGRKEINQYDIALKYGKVRTPVEDKQCLYCGATLNFTGQEECNNHGDYQDDDFAMIDYYNCPKCGRTYEVWEPKAEDREHLEYWNK